MSEPIREALRRFGYEPCTDGACLLRSPEEQQTQGMHTNGGCKCEINFSEKHMRLSLRWALQIERRARSARLV